MQFLSDEYMREVTQRLRSDEPVLASGQGQTLTIQYHVERTEGEPIDYWLAIADGTPTMALGRVDDPDASIEQTYEVAAAIDCGEMNAQSALVQGKTRVTGNLLTMMALQPLLEAVSNVAGDFEREY